VASGFFYAFTLWRYVRLPHLHLLGVQYLPLTLLFTDRLFDQGLWRDAVLLSCALALQALSSFYLAYALALAYAPALVLTLAHWRDRLDRRRAVGLLAAIGAAGAVFLVTSIPYIRLQRLGLIPEYDPHWVPLMMLPAFTAGEVFLYLRGGVGIVAYALIATALVSVDPRRRWPVRLAVTLACVGILAAFGPRIRLHGHLLWSPYSLLMDWVPGFSTVRFPQRFLIIVQLGVALLAGLGLERAVELASRRAGWLRAGWPLAALVIAVALLRAGPFPRRSLHVELTGSQVPAAYRWLAVHGEGRALLEVPTGDLTKKSSAQRMYLSTYHWLPIVDAYSGYMPGTVDYLNRLASGLPATSAVQALVNSVDVGWILVHRAEIAPPWKARWAPPFPPGLEVIGQFGDDILLRVTLPMSEDHRSTFVSRQVTRSGRPLRPLERCSARVEVRHVSRSPGERAELELEVQNTGDEWWPVESFYAAHTVELLGQIVDADGRTLEPKAVAFDRDVAPGETVARTLVAAIPRSRGEHVLELEVAQIENGRFVRCGAGSVRVPFTISPATQAVAP